MTIKEIKIQKIKAIFFDFDGVLTNNFVYLDESGKESVRCSRSDGLAFDALRKLKIPTYILSTEMNKIVSSRAKKLKSPVFQGLGNKSNTLKMIIKKILTYQIFFILEMI